MPDTPARAVVEAWRNECGLPLSGDFSRLTSYQRLEERIDAALRERERATDARWRQEAIEAIPNCSTDGDDYRMAKLAARGWRVLAVRIYGELMNLREQVLRYRVPSDAKYIDALNRVDTLMRDYAAVLAARGET